MIDIFRKFQGEKTDKQSQQENPRTLSLGFASSTTIHLGLQDCIKQPSLDLRYHALPRNRITYSAKRIHSQKAQSLLQSVFSKMQGNRTQILKKSLSSSRPQMERHRRMPDSIVGNLYRQNIKNYNAFVATLQAVEEESGLSLIQKERIAKLCHIGIAKQFIKTKKYSQGPIYNRVNVQIRPYMREKMHEQVKSREQKYENVVFIPTNELALSFNPNSYPGLLQESIPKAQYASIINHVNGIIEKEYVDYKGASSHSESQSLFARILLILIVFATVILFISPFREMLAVIFGLIVVWLLLSVQECGGRLNKLVRSKDVTNTISQKIKDFFQKINNQQTQWRVGQDFYWLEIHFIKKKKNPMVK